MGKEMMIFTLQGCDRIEYYSIRGLSYNRAVFNMILICDYMEIPAKCMVNAINIRQLCPKGARETLQWVKHGPVVDYKKPL